MTKKPSLQRQKWAQAIKDVTNPKRTNTIKYAGETKEENIKYIEALAVKRVEKARVLELLKLDVGKK